MLSKLEQLKDIMKKDSTALNDLSTQKGPIIASRQKNRRKYVGTKKKLSKIWTGVCISNMISVWKSEKLKYDVSVSREKKSDDVLETLKFLTKELVYFYMGKILISSKSGLCVCVILLVVVFLAAEGLANFDSRVYFGEKWNNASFFNSWCEDD